MRILIILFLLAIINPITSNSIPPTNCPDVNLNNVTKLQFPTTANQGCRCHGADMNYNSTSNICENRTDDICGPGKYAKIYEFVQRTSICESCANTCETCQGPIICSQCQQGYYLTENFQCRKCRDGCKSCDKFDDCKICLAKATQIQGYCTCLQNGDIMHPTLGCVTKSTACPAEYKALQIFKRQVCYPITQETLLGCKTKNFLGSCHECDKDYGFVKENKANRCWECENNCHLYTHNICMGAGWVQTQQGDQLATTRCQQVATSATCASGIFFPDETCLNESITTCDDSKGRVQVDINTQQYCLECPDNCGSCTATLIPANTSDDLLKLIPEITEINGSQFQLQCQTCAKGYFHNTIQTQMVECLKCNSLKCAECKGSTDNCSVCQPDREKAPSCICKGGKISDSKGNCVDNATCDAGSVMVEEFVNGNKDAVKNSFINTVCQQIDDADANFNKESQKNYEKWLKKCQDQKQQKDSGNSSDEDSGNSSDSEKSSDSKSSKSQSSSDRRLRALNSQNEIKQFLEDFRRFLPLDKSDTNHYTIVRNRNLGSGQESGSEQEGSGQESGSEQEGSGLDKHSGDECDDRRYLRLLHTQVQTQQQKEQRAQCTAVKSINTSSSTATSIKEKKCASCGYACQTCQSNPAADDSNPVKTVCSKCAEGFYLLTEPTTGTFKKEYLVDREYVLSLPTSSNKLYQFGVPQIQYKPLEVKKREEQEKNWNKIYEAQKSSQKNGYGSGSEKDSDKDSDSDSGSEGGQLMFRLLFPKVYDQSNISYDIINQEPKQIQSQYEIKRIAFCEKKQTQRKRSVKNIFDFLQKKQKVDYVCPTPEPKATTAQVNNVTFDPEIHTTFSWCGMCAPNCKSCEGSSTNCQTCNGIRENAPYCTCPKGTLENSNGDCETFDLSQINDSSYVASVCEPPMFLLYDDVLNVSTCLQCLPDCQKCGVDLNYDVFCIVPGCNANQFYDSYVQKCINCDSKCGTCSQQSSNCLTCAVNRVSAPFCQCASGYFQDSNDGCVKFIVGVTQKKNACGANGVLVNNQICQYCETGCEQCVFDASVIKCAQAAPGFGLITNPATKAKTVVPCIEGCLDCNFKGSIFMCTKAAGGYKLNSDGSVTNGQCIPKCGSCSPIFADLCLTCDANRENPPNCFCKAGLIEDLASGKCLSVNSAPNPIIKPPEPCMVGLGQALYWKPDGTSVCVECGPGCLNCDLLNNSGSPDGYTISCQTCLNDQYILNPLTNTCNFFQGDTSVDMTTICSKGQYAMPNALLGTIDCINCPFPCSDCTAIGGFVCSQCPAGYSYDQNSPSAVPCSKCSEGCGTCSFLNGIETCSNCLFGLVLDTVSKKCLPLKGVALSCPQGSVQSVDDFGITFCQRCAVLIPGCKTCSFDASTSATVCDTCQASLILSSTDNTCSKKCSDANYFSNDTGVCVSCPQGCSDCIESSRGFVQCSGCDFGYVSFLGKCIKQCPSSTSIGVVGQFFNSITGTCQNCAAGCDNCKEDNSKPGSSICQQCLNDPTLQLVRGQCSPINEFKSSSTCPVDTNYLVLDSTTGEVICKQCPNSCTKCQLADINNPSGLSCSLCRLGYKLIDSECILDITCDSGKYQFYNQTSKQYDCLDCPSGCNFCNYSPQLNGPLCKLCDFTQFSRFDTTTQTLICQDYQSCASNEFSKLVLNPTSNLYEQVCTACPNNCTKCTYSNPLDGKSVSATLNPTCLQCATDFVLTNSKTLCAQTASSISTVIECSQGEYAGALSGTSSDVKICLKCPENTLTCEEQAGSPVAITCDQNSQLVNGVCLLNCWDGLYYNSIKNRCMACIKNCVVCKDETTCIQCGQGYYHDTVTGACLPNQKTQCPLKSVYDNETSRCICKDPYVWNDQLTECVSATTSDSNAIPCPQGSFRNKSNDTCQSCLSNEGSCQYCIGPNPAECQRCMDGQYLNSKFECVSCSSNCLRCDSKTCLQCEIGFFRETDTNGRARCFESCSSGFLPSLDSLYTENPELYDPVQGLVDTSTNNPLYRAPNEDEELTAISYAIGSSGNHIWDIVLVPFLMDPTSGKFQSYLNQGSSDLVPVRATCLPCKQRCSLCPNNQIMDLSKGKCIANRNECLPNNIISLYTDADIGSYYICGPAPSNLPISASVIVQSADVKGYQLSQNDLRVQANINIPNMDAAAVASAISGGSTASTDPTSTAVPSVRISWTVTEIYDGTTLNVDETFNDLAPLDLLPETDSLYIQNLFQNNQETEGSNLLVRAKFLKSNVVYKIQLKVTSGIDGSSYTVDFEVAVQPLPIMRALSELNVMTTSGAVAISPDEGTAIETIFSASYDYTTSDIIEELSGTWKFGIIYFPSDRQVGTQVGWNNIAYSSQATDTITFKVPFIPYNKIVIIRFFAEKGGVTFFEDLKIRVFTSDLNVYTSPTLDSLKNDFSNQQNVNLADLSLLSFSLSSKVYAINSGKADTFGVIDRKKTPDDSITLVNVVPNENVNLYERVDLTLCPINCHNNNGECVTDAATGISHCQCKPGFNGEACNSSNEEYDQLKEFSSSLVQFLAAQNDTNLDAMRQKISICSAISEVYFNTISTLSTVGSVLKSTLPSINSATAVSQSMGAVSNIADRIVRQYSEAPLDGTDKNSKRRSMATIIEAQDTISQIESLRKDIITYTSQILNEGVNFININQGGMYLKVMLIDFNSNEDDQKNIELSIGDTPEFQANFTFSSDLLKLYYTKVAAGMIITPKEWNFAYSNYSDIVTNVVDFMFINIDDPSNPKLIDISNITDPELEIQITIPKKNQNLIIDNTDSTSILTENSEVPVLKDQIDTNATAKLNEEGTNQIRWINSCRSIKDGVFEESCEFISETKDAYVVNTTHLSSFAIAYVIDPLSLPTPYTNKFDYFTSAAFYLILIISILFLIGTVAAIISDINNRNQNKIQPGASTSANQAAPKIQPLAQHTKLRAFIELRNSLKIIYLQAYHQKRTTRTLFYWTYQFNLHSIAGLFVTSYGDVMAPIVISVFTGIAINFIKGLSVKNRITKIISYVLAFGLFILNIFLIPLSDGFYYESSNDIWVVNSIVALLCDLIILDTLRSWLTVFLIKQTSSNASLWTYIIDMPSIYGFMEKYGHVDPSSGSPVVNEGVKAETSYDHVQDISFHTELNQSVVGK